MGKFYGISTANIYKIHDFKTRSVGLSCSNLSICLQNYLIYICLSITVFQFLLTADVSSQSILNSLIMFKLNIKKSRQKKFDQWMENNSLLNCSEPKIVPCLTAFLPACLPGPPRSADSAIKSDTEEDSRLQYSSHETCNKDTDMQARECESNIKTETVDNRCRDNVDDMQTKEAARYDDNVSRDSMEKLVDEQENYDRGLCIGTDKEEMQIKEELVEEKQFKFMDYTEPELKRHDGIRSQANNKAMFAFSKIIFENAKPDYLNPDLQTRRKKQKQSFKQEKLVEDRKNAKKRKKQTCKNGVNKKRKVKESNVHSVEKSMFEDLKQLYTLSEVDLIKGGLKPIDRLRKSRYKVYLNSSQLVFMATKAKIFKTKKEVLTEKFSKLLNEHKKFYKSTHDLPLQLSSRLIRIEQEKEQRQKCENHSPYIKVNISHLESNQYGPEIYVYRCRYCYYESVDFYQTFLLHITNPPGECKKINKASCLKCPTCSKEDQKQKPDLIREVEEAQQQIQKEVNDDLVNIGRKICEENVISKLYPSDIYRASKNNIKERIVTNMNQAGSLNDFTKCELITLCKAIENGTINKESKKNGGNSFEDLKSKIRTERKLLKTKKEEQIKRMKRCSYSSLEDYRRNRNATMCIPYVGSSIEKQEKEDRKIIAKTMEKELRKERKKKDQNLWKNLVCQHMLSDRQLHLCHRSGLPRIRYNVKNVLNKKKPSCECFTAPRLDEMKHPRPKKRRLREFKEEVRSSIDLYRKQKNLDSIFPEVRGVIERKYGINPLTELRIDKPKKKITIKKTLNNWINVEIVEKTEQTSFDYKKPTKLIDHKLKKVPQQNKVTISDFKHIVKIKQVFKNETQKWHILNPPIKKHITRFPKYCEAERATKDLDEEMPVVNFSGFSTIFITEHVLTYNSTANEE